MKFNDICRIYNIFPAQIYALQGRGVLPERNHGEISIKFLLCLAEYRNKQKRLNEAMVDVIGFIIKEDRLILTQEQESRLEVLKGAL